MTFSPEQAAELDAPLSKSVVKKNPRGFDYVEAWHAIAEANRIFGHDGWVRELLDLRVIGERQAGEQWRISYRATVRITAGGIYRDGSGFGSGVMRDYEQAHESALKEAESDAMKRALMTFGNPFGLALYDKTQANVVDGPAQPPTPAEPSAAVAAACAAINMCATSAELKAWWEEHKARINALPDTDYVPISNVMRAKTAELKPKAVSHG